MEREQSETETERERLQEHIHEQSMHFLKRLPALGPIIALYLQSSHRRFHFISDLEWLVLPPLVRDQCKMYLKGEYPVSFVSWALLDEAAERRLLSNGGKLRPEDWGCGDRPWIIDIVSPFGGIGKVLTDIRSREFAGRTVRMLVPDTKTGGMTTRELPPKYKTEPEPAEEHDNGKPH